MSKRWLRLLFLLLLGISINSVSAIGEIKDILGKIAIVDTDYNIFTYSPSNDSLIQLTDDASSSRHYQWITWSSDGRLAYFCCEASPDGQVFISPDGISDPELAHEKPGTFTLYAYWSPADCGDNCRELAILVNNSQGLSLDILTDSEQRSTVTAGTGGPYYYHWDSTGTQMIFHRGNQNLDIYSRVENDIIQTLTNSSGLFQAPAWSPIDDRILVAIPSSIDGASNLSIIENGEISTLVEDILGFISFLWSPDGRYIAYRTADQFGYNGITVLDARSGDIIAVEDSTSVPAFFWSPDSKKIAYLSIIESDDARNADANIRVAQEEVSAQLTWNVLDIESQTNLSYSSFIPTFEMIYLFTYFDQFAPSHRLWSPDSRWLTFAGRLDSNQTVSQIYMLDIEDINAEPEAVTEGIFGIWSFE